MKTKTIFLALFTAMLFTAVSCDSDDTDNRTGVINLSHSDCKDDAAKMLNEQVTFTVTGNNQLNVEHLNSYLNCEPGQIIVESNISNDTIYIEEITDNLADCICPYDITFSIRPVEFGTYTVSLKGLFFDLEVCEGMNSTFDLDY